MESPDLLLQVRSMAPVFIHIFPEEQRSEPVLHALVEFCSLMLLLLEFACGGLLYSS